MSPAKRLLALCSIAALFYFVAAKARARPTPSPAIAKFNSVISKKPPAAAIAGQAPIANGSGGAAWANVKGTALDSNPASNGMVLEADGNGGAFWASLQPLPQSLTANDSPTFAGLTLTTGPLNIPPGSLPASSLASSPLFGDGSDGDVTLASDATLARDMYYNNLTVNSGSNLNTNGFRVFVKATCTLNGSIRNNGVGISGAPSGTLGGGASGAPAFGSANTPGLPGAGSSNAAGGGGGAAGGSTTFNAGAPGGIATVPSANDGGVQALRAVPLALTCRSFSGTAVTGGSGGSSGTNSNSNNSGGVGGGGGGVVMLAAHAFAGTGVVQARGGDGSAGKNTATDGGGGGGGGGVVVIVTTAPLPPSISADASGGAGGPGPANVTAAKPGNVGTVVVLY